MAGLIWHNPAHAVYLVLRLVKLSVSIAPVAGQIRS